MPESIAVYLSYIVISNFLLTSVVLVVLGKYVMAHGLEELPGARQNAAELVLDWFVNQARRMDAPSVNVIAPFLASLFLMILFSNLLAVLPIPILNIPPASYFSVPLGLALIAVLGALVVAAWIRGVPAALRHLFWPNPLQLVGEVSHTLSLSLRLYGNIGGEWIVATLAAQAAPYGIPLVIHALGLVPATVQPLVFILLTVNFLELGMHRFAPPKRAAAAPAEALTSIEQSRGIARTQ
jgi:F-type H+-transporting ATPase subunit a